MARTFQARKTPKKSTFSGAVPTTYGEVVTPDIYGVQS